MARGNGKIFYDAPNRGSKRIVSFLNDAPATNDPSTLEDAGNGFLMRQGYTIVWCGWQGDLMPQKNWLVMGVPVATNDGKEIVDKVRTEIVVEKKESNPSRSAATSASRVTELRRATRSQASLTVREKSYGHTYSRANLLNGNSLHARKIREPAKKQSSRAAKNSTFAQASNQAISTSSSIRQRIHWFLAWALPSYAI